MKLQAGYLHLGHWRGAPVRVHWSAPVGALFFGQLRFVPGFWLAFIGLILVHELGHALMVTLAGARVRGIDVTGLGGECRHDGNVTAMGRALVAWGGVLAQLAVLLVVGAMLLVFGAPRSIFLAEMADACVYYNLVLMGLNLLPLPSLDGHEAWKLLPVLRARWNARRTASLPRLHDPEAEVARLREILARSRPRT